jgi:hypothetical protein
VNMQVVSILHNIKLNRWHPITFELRPPPGGQLSETACRYKSRGHHTEGFETREAALKWIDTIHQERNPDSGRSLNADFVWSGEDVPAMVVHFLQKDDGSYDPMF